MTEKKVSWSDLRKEYPDIPFVVFLGFIKEISLNELDEEGMEVFQLILKEENEKGKATKDAEKEILQERLKFITASMVHGELDINVPSQLDKKHVQAYIVYGLIMPSSSRTFAGSRDVSQQTIRNFVKSKLGRVFDQAKHERAESWLIKQGVINTSGGFTLNLKENTRKVSPEGQAIITEAKRLMYKYRPTRQK